MVKSHTPCDQPDQERKKSWPYYESYTGERDEENRKNGEGENHWTSAESMEWYCGKFLRNTMHGEGDYRWRFKDQEGLFCTYEGRFYANNMHGYGRMSYPDGRNFLGLYYKNTRVGPGVETSLAMRANVGLWYGHQLIRLAWQPSTPSIAPDFSSGTRGPEFVEPFRTVLQKRITLIGRTNSAIELMKKCGADPVVAAQKWPKLYPINCTDLDSLLCHVDVFDHNYYDDGKIKSLEVFTGAQEIEYDSDDDASGEPKEDGETNKHFAWNNNELMIQIMQLCYKHEDQRSSTDVNLARILNGPRKRFKTAADHEKNCRTLLMASYLGHIVNVVQLVNDFNVHPDVADMQGNTAIIYATAGDQPEIIHFLVEAGANPNTFNDSCCTPLGVALMRYLCATANIVPNSMVQAMTPPDVPKSQGSPVTTEQLITDWHISRTNQQTGDTNTNKEKKLSKPNVDATKTYPPAAQAAKKKTETSLKNIPESEMTYESDDSMSETTQEYSNINQEYTSMVNSLMSAPNPSPVTYIFEAGDMVHDVKTLNFSVHNALNVEGAAVKGHSKKTSAKTVKEKEKSVVSKKTSSLQQNQQTSENDSLTQLKEELKAKIMLTIIQLLSDGADPKLVTFPQPALFMAVVSGSSDLVHHLINHGADMNVKYPATHSYTPLDIAISRPLTLENVEVIKAILESGADTNHRLAMPPGLLSAGDEEILGPTLLHTLLAKKTTFEFEEEIRNNIIELLLQYNCDPTAQFLGRSAIDIAMMQKIDLINLFMRSPKVNLNAIINEQNQTILVKMFDLPFFRATLGMNRLPILTNLLLFGADPLIECRNGDNVYKNLFVFAHENLTSILPKVTKTADSKTNVKHKPKPKGKEKNAKHKDAKGKDAKGKNIDSKKVDKSKPKEQSIVVEYKEALDLVRECARLLHTRWLQAKLVKELIDVIYKYKHRPWVTIYKEHKNAQCVGLWLTTQHCLEIWSILKTTRKKIYRDEKILKRLLCIVQFYNKRQREGLPLILAMTATEKDTIESDVSFLMAEHRIASKLKQEAMKKLYVKPELIDRNDPRFNVCFECALPLALSLAPNVTGEDMSPKTATDADLGEASPMGLFECPMCKLVTFCNLQCLKINMERPNCHPCSDQLKIMYFPRPLNGE